MLLILLGLATSAAPALEEGGGLHPNEAQELALKDAKKHPKDDAPYQRYFRVSTPKAVRDDFLVTFCLHLNKLSTRKKFRWPSFVSPDVLRIDVRDYGWDERGKDGDNVLLVWERTAAMDPYFHQQAIVKADLDKDTGPKGSDQRLPIAWPGGFDVSRKKRFGAGVYKTPFAKGKTVPVAAAWLDQDDALKLKYLLLTESPILDAEWFFVQTSRQRSLYGEKEPGIGYYDFLALKDRDAFFELAGLDPKVAKKINQTWKGAVAESGVAHHNRLVFRFGAHARFVWGTFDTLDPRERGDLFQNLRDGEFKHQAEEWFAVLANGLDYTFLSNDKGERQATAPDDIISADVSKVLTDSNKKYRHNDTPVHANISCVGCHGGSDMLMDVNDRIRQAFPKQRALLLVDKDKKITRELEDEYLTSLEKELKRDRLIYVDAVKDVTTSKLYPDGWTTGELAVRYREAFDRYAYAPLTHAQAARELGVEKKKMLSAIKTYASSRGRGQSDILLTTWAEDGRGMKRTSWEQRYALAMTLSLGLAPPETLEEKKVEDPLRKKDK